MVPFGRFLGYERGEDGSLVVNEEQAQIVRRIYGMFLQGRSPYTIARRLTEEGISTPGGKMKWSGSTVRSILTNEKYKGDALLQKVYTVDFLTKKKKVNEGEVPQYYVEHNHDAIITPAVFEEAQILMKAGRPGKERQSSTGLFSGMLRCGDCGSWYGSKVWHSNDRYRRVVWQCNHKFDGEEKCSTPHLDEETIKRLFVRAAGILYTEKEEIIECMNAAKEMVFDIGELESQQEQLREEMAVVTEMIQQCIHENARVVLDQTEYQKKYNGLSEWFNRVKEHLDETTHAIAERKARRGTIERFLAKLEQQEEMPAEFKERLWRNLVDHVTIFR